MPRCILLQDIAEPVDPLSVGEAGGSGSSSGGGGGTIKNRLRKGAGGGGPLVSAHLKLNEQSGATLRHCCDKFRSTADNKPNGESSSSSSGPGDTRGGYRHAISSFMQIVLTLLKLHE
jgi:hypothetical protein